MAKHLVFLISGRQGSGKSTLADELIKKRPYGWGSLRTKFAATLYAIHDAARDKAREYGIPYPDKFGSLLQTLGTELGRNHFGENVWVEALLRHVKKELGREDQTAVIIDDMRFENEFHAFDGIKGELDADVVRIRLKASRDVRRGRTDSWRDNDLHPSETGLDGYEDRDRFDLVFQTDDGVLNPEQMANLIWDWSVDRHKIL